ncbi:immunoglobulin-like domain-containing protein [Listeria booriae]|uniref:Bacterial Ig domain-containing protein n=1 Tax=Listeria booriae TaxID=1552123 RepID=A0A7X1CKT6_9LIST|nr:immunoglobulin-like domain-containing protein [Listeria booriae]MBC1792493.1 hypothetical protein [Listeria booriae]MBC1801970.1 hypothetical protein [Listeria booriae]MBC1804381.1 hypothetical protein [Listeria booriae]MBC1813866.1 hypothetical protein [Listeria booriae]
MKRKQTLKRVATAVVTVNVLASTFITTLPAKSFAAENPGTSAEQRLVGSGLQSIQNENLINNPSFQGNGTSIPSWDVSEYTDYSVPRTTGVRYVDGVYQIWADTYRSNYLQPVDGGLNIYQKRMINNGYIAYVGQDITVVKGQTYKLDTAYQYASGSVDKKIEIRCINFNEDGSVNNSNTSGWLTPTQAKNNYQKTATATSSKMRVEYKVLGLGGSDAIGVGGAIKVYNPTLTNTDQTAPTAPTVATDVFTNSTTVTGTAEANSTVSVKANDEVIGTAVTNASGNYSVTIPKQAYNTSLVITAKDVAGNISDATTINVKQGPVLAPTIAVITSKSTTASGTGEPGATLAFKANGVSYPTTVASNGAWSVTIPKQAASTVVEATAVLNGVSSTKATATVAYEGPNSPVLNNVTNRSTKVTGTGDPGNTVTVKIKTGDDSISYIGTIDDFGEFSINIDTPEAGATVEAIAKDSENTLSQKTSKTVLDVIAPDAPTVQAIKDTDTKVTGRGEANCDVTVTLSSGGTLDGVTDADGKFSITIPKQTAGRNIKVNLTDTAGNVGTATTVIVQADVLANPTVNRISNQDTKATGTGVAGATVTLTANGHDYTTEVGTDGKYEVTIPKLAAGLNVVVKQAKDNKTSGSVATVVQDDRTPAKPAVNPVKDSDTKATGTGTAGDTIKVTLPNGDVATGVVATDGTWAVTIPAQAAGSELDVTATGPNGRTSDATEVAIAQTPQTGTLTTNDFTMGRDQYIVGSYTGDVKKFRITIGDKVYEGGSLDTVRKTYTFYAVDKAVEGNFTIAALDKYGNVLDTKTAKMIRQSTRTPVAPVVNPVKDSDTKVTGTGVAGDTIKATLPNGDVKTGIIAADGTWSITIPAQAAGAKIDVTATTPDNKVSPKTTITIAQTLQTGAIATANNFKIGTDKYITGTFTGSVKSLRVTIGTNVYTGGTLDTTAGTFSFYALATATAAGTYKIEGLDKYGNVLNSKTASIIAAGGGSGVVGTGTVVADPFVIHTSKNVTGTVTGDVKTLKLVYDGVTYTGGTIATDKAFTFYALDKILNKSKSARIDGYDANGNKIATSTITLTDSQDNSSTVGTGTVVADDFKLGTSKNITGKYTGDVKSIKVRVGDTTYAGGTLADGDFSFYALDKITSLSQVVFVDGYDKNGNKIATSIVSITSSAPAVASIVTPASYTVPGDKYLTGTYTGDIKSVVVTINGTDYTGGTVADGAINFWIGDKISSTNDVVTIKGYNTAGALVSTKIVNLIAAQPAEGTITPATFSLKTSSISGTYTGEGKSLRLTVNGVALPAGGTVANNSFAYYVGIKNKVTSTSDVVKIALLDKNGLVMQEKSVTIID